MKPLVGTLLCALSFSLAVVAPTPAQEVTTLTEVIQGGTGGLAVDDAGNIYMGDFGQTLDGPLGTRVFKVDPNGNVSVFVNGQNGYSGNDFDAEGNLYQSNFGIGAVVKITPDGTVTTFASGLSTPIGIVVDDSGDLFVCNCGNNTVQKITSAGASSVFASSTLFRCPNGITMDEDGNLFVSNFSDGRVLKIEPDGNVLFWANIPGGNNGHLTYFENELYVAARGANQIYKIDPDRNVALFAGNGAREVVDGPLLEAGFSLPNDVIFDSTGRYLYVNDVVNPVNNRDTAPMVLRRIDLGDPATVETANSATAPVRLGTISPNPFRTESLVTFRLSESSTVDLAIYNVRGERVRTLVRAPLGSGEYTERWDGRNDDGIRVASGVYFFRLESDGKTQSRPVRFVR